MEMTFDVGEHERHTVIYSWSQWSGRLRISVDGNPIVNSVQMFSASLSKTNEFTVGRSEQHHVRIVKERPLVASAFRPQPITAYVDGQQVAHEQGTMRRGQTAVSVVVIGVIVVIGVGAGYFSALH